MQFQCLLNIIECNSPKTENTKRGKQPAKHAASTSPTTIIRCWTQNFTDTVRRTRVNVGQCLLEDDSTRWNTRFGRVVTTRTLWCHMSPSNEFVRTHQSKRWQHVFYRGNDSDLTSQLVSRFADIRSNSFRSHRLTFSKLIVKILWQSATTHQLWLTGFNH